MLTQFNEPDDVIESQMIGELNRILGDHPRIELAAGTMIFHQDDALDGIYILLEGKVSLFQLIDGREVVFHLQTVGKILGLLALTRHSHSFFNCRAITPVQLMKIRFEELDRALQESESLLVSFIAVLLRSMARRNKRLVELQTEVLGLNKSLGSERDNLARILKELQQAQALLVESEKMATLGQLAAGVAHELNNPVAAIDRAAEFVHEDLLALVAELPNGAVAREMLERTFQHKPTSTREQREYRRQLSQETGDEQLAEQLVGMGIHSIEDFHRLTDPLSGDRDKKLASLNRYHQLGSALRNIEHCADRISRLVKSLRSYIHADHPDESAVDIHLGIEDTLRLFSNRLHEVEIDRQYADLPPIVANAGELNQVWTNLIANALDAMKNRGRLTIRSSVESNDCIAVRIVDNGPGIPPENLKKIFSLKFTTRQGRVEFGLGLGLSITQNIVTRHGGHIDVASQPGHTEFCVTLPIYPTDRVTSANQESAS